jgi:DNA-binding MarR family transcriptional regulator
MSFILKEEKAKYNVRKYLILCILFDQPFLKSKQIWQQMVNLFDPNVTLHAVRCNLTRLYRQGLVSRKRIELRTYLYALTPKGKERLMWLKRNIYI